MRLEMTTAEQWSCCWTWTSLRLVVLDNNSKFVNDLEHFRAASLVLDRRDCSRWRLASFPIQSSEDLMLEGRQIGNIPFIN